VPGTKTSPIRSWLGAKRREHGRLSGWLRYHLGRAQIRLGWARGLARVDWNSVSRLVFVCRGNICRSPYAEGRAKEAGIRATSFGLEADGRSPADEVAHRVAASRGIALDGHVTRQAEQVPIEEGDLVIGMEPWHIKRFLRGRGGSSGRQPQVTLLGLWGPEPLLIIEDPFGRDEAYFHRCFERIDQAIEGMRRRMEEGER
jgi:protein-tyrosine phosphatase